MRVKYHHGHPRRGKDNEVQQGSLFDEEGKVALGRFILAIGDQVRVLPSSPRRRDGFVGRVMRWHRNESGDPTHADVWGGPARRAPLYRTLPIERICGMRQP